jgi:uncharacterized protein (DUF427 family)
MTHKESVWDYPRPPRLEPVSKLLVVEFCGETIAKTQRGYRVLETSHPPVYYIPPDDVQVAFLLRAPGSSFCEWKGAATYWSLDVRGQRSEQAAWSYARPTAAFAPIQGYLAFYAGRVDACFVAGEKVTPQPGGFYGGWITEDLVGPFKGGPGSAGW